MFFINEKYKVMLFEGFVFKYEFCMLIEYGKFKLRLLFLVLF